MDQNGVEDDVDNSTGGLGDHGVHGTAGGLQQTLAQNTDEYAKRKDTADRRVGDTGFHSFCNGGLHLIIRTDTEETEEHEADGAKKHQEKAVPSGPVGGFLILFAQRFAQQRVDTYTDTHGIADLQILDGEGQRKGGDGAFGNLGYINAVDYIVKCLYQHGDDHRQCHVDQQLANGHDTHFVFRKRILAHRWLLCNCA